MTRGVYARRYAQAAFEIALERRELDRWQSDLRKIASLGEDAELVALLESPKCHFDDKAKVLSERLADINPLALNLAHLLLARGELGMVADIAEEYQRRLDDYRGVEQAEVISAVSLDDEDRLRLADHLEAIVGKKVVLKSEVDSSLIGGFIARVGGRLLDGSTRRKLEALRRDLVRAGR